MEAREAETGVVILCFLYKSSSGLLLGTSRRVLLDRSPSPGSRGLASLSGGFVSGLLLRALDPTLNLSRTRALGHPQGVPLHALTHFRTRCPFTNPAVGRAAASVSYT